MKQVYFFRHGEADWPDWEEDDDLRPLTKRGRAEVKRVARFLRRLGAEPLLVFTSPVARAHQTARLVAKELCAELGVESSLGQAFNVRKFTALVAAHDVREMVLVGHGPYFDQVIRALTGGRLQLSKAGVALLEVDDAATKGTLRWFFPPRFAKRA